MNWYKIAKYGDQMRKLWLAQGYSDAIIDSYLDTFNEFRKVKISELFNDIPNVNIPRDKRIDITVYRDFKQLENVVDYVKGQRAPKQDNVGGTNVAPIYENEEIAVYRGDNAQECIAIRGSDNASWCVAAKSGNMYGAYRYRENEPTFYFVKDKGINHTKYNFFVIQVTNEGKYVVTSHSNDGDKTLGWNEIINLQPKLKNLQDLFISIPIPKEKKLKYEYYNNIMKDTDFAKLSYEEKKECLDMAGYEIMNDVIFKELPNDLKNYYIGFGVGLTNNQFNMIKDDKVLMKRYKEIVDRKTIEFVNAGEYLYALTKTDILVLDIDNNKEFQDILLNRCRNKFDVPSSPGGFVMEWVKREVKKEWSVGSGEWLKIIAKSIIEDSVEDELLKQIAYLSNYSTNFSVPNDIMDAITDYISKHGFAPSILSGWCKALIDSGKAPQGWEDGVLRFVKLNGHPPSFAMNWYYNIYSKREAIETIETIEANLNWYERKKVIAAIPQLYRTSYKHVQDGTYECRYCLGELIAKDVIHGKHFFSPGQLYTCSCGKSKIWTNSVRFPEELKDYCDGKEVISNKHPEYYGFCNDLFCPVCWDNIRVIKDNRWGCPKCKDNNKIFMFGEKLNESEGQRQTAIWYKNHQELWRNKV